MIKKIGKNNFLDKNSRRIPHFNPNKVQYIYILQFDLTKLMMSKSNNHFHCKSEHLKTICIFTISQIKHTRIQYSVS
jgi:hypothetical protein